MVPTGKKSRKTGQAAVEYVLLIAVVSVLFGLLFTGIRQSLYRLWVCELAPRVQSPGGCINSTQPCWTAIGKTPEPFCTVN
jgi:hypothetical protein